MEENFVTGLRYAGAEPQSDADCPLKKFSDLDPAAWYHDSIHWALENGVMNGVGDGLFQPDGTTTRATVAVMLWRMENSPVVNYEMDYTDVGDAWYTEGVRWATSVGIINGYSDESGNRIFAPDAPVLREELATMLYRYAKLKGMGFTGAWSFRLDYADADSVSSWAYEPMCWMTMNGVITGLDDASGNRILAPGVTSVRSVVATMFYRFCTQIVK